MSVEKLRAFDCHTHLLTGDRAAGDEKVTDGQRLFGAHGSKAPDDRVGYYRESGLAGIVFDVDSQTTSGQRIDNDTVLEFAAASDGVFMPFCSVDPNLGRRAIMELERCAGAGALGVKFQPITQAFFVDDPAMRPIWGACDDLGLTVLIHSGTTAIGNGSPGGRGLKLKYGRPIHIDDVAADFPRLRIIAAHPGWPWSSELLAVARHKGNVWIDLSGWGPKYLPEETFRYANSVMPEKFLFGSDFPLMDPNTWLDAFVGLPWKPAARRRILFENACELFGLDPSRFSDEWIDRAVKAEVS